MAQQGLDGGFGSVSLGTAAQAGLVGAGAGVAAGAGIALAGLAAGVGLSGGGAALATGGSIAGGATISGVTQGAAVVGGFAAGSGVNYAQGNGGNRSGSSSSKPLTPAQKARAENTAKGIPESQLGPSGKPKIHNVDLPSKKAAQEAAQQAGAGKPMQHPSPTVGKGHYHPTDANGKKIPGVHYNYPD
jgi:hypothetical protein